LEDVFPGTSYEVNGVPREADAARSRRARQARVQVATVGTQACTLNNPTREMEKEAAFAGF
jgi:hypothetical protein